MQRRKVAPSVCSPGPCWVRPVSLLPPCLTPISVSLDAELKSNHVACVGCLRLELSFDNARVTQSDQSGAQEKTKQEGEFSSCISNLYIRRSGGSHRRSNHIKQAISNKSIMFYVFTKMCRKTGRRTNLHLPTSACSHQQRALTLARVVFPRRPSASGAKFYPPPCLKRRKDTHL